MQRSALRLRPMRDTKPRHRKRNQPRKVQVVKPGRMQVYGAALSQLRNDVGWLKRLVNVEIKYLDTAATAQASSTTATFVLLNGMQRGDENQNRQGNSIKMQRLLLSFTMTVNPTAVTSEQRVMVIRDKVPTNAQFAIGNLLNATNSRSPYVPEFADRLIPHYDQSFMLASTGSNYILTDKLALNLNVHAKYADSQNAGTIADINEQALYLVFFSDQATNTVTFNYYARLEFTDN